MERHVLCRGKGDSRGRVSRPRRRGDHLFVDKSTDRIEFATPPADEKWMAMKTAVDVTGAGDRTIRVTVGDDHRMRPLAGTVVDPDGNPVGHAEVSLVDADPEVRNRGGGSGYLRLSATTDAQGRFSFAAAPDSCMIEVTRASASREGAAGMDRFGARRSPGPERQRAVASWRVDPRVAARGHGE